MIKNEINKINSNEANAPNYIYATTIIESQLSIYSFFFEKFIAVLDKKEEIALSEVSKKLHENISKSYLLLIKIIYILIGNPVYLNIPYGFCLWVICRIICSQLITEVRVPAINIKDPPRRI